MSEFGGLWKHPNNPACAKSVKSLQNVEVGHCTKEENLVGYLLGFATKGKPRDMTYIPLHFVSVSASET